jgi:tRNA pseudouridine55 synthase
VDAARVAESLARFRGAIEQVPPMYSALKHGGQPLYALARAGQTVERAARQVTVHELELLEFAGDLLHLRIKCSKGTYVRQLAVDLGAELGTVAHLAALRRTAVAGFRLDRAVTLDDLQAMGEAARRTWLLPPDSLLADLPRLELAEEQARRFLNGQSIPLDASEGACCVYGAQGALLGVGEVFAEGSLRPVRLLASG